MKPALAQVSSLDSAFAKDVEDYAAGKCNALELWLGKLDQYLDKHSIDDLIKARPNVRALLGIDEIRPAALAS